MDLLHKLVEVSPYLLIGLALVIHALAYLVAVRAKADPSKTWEDDWAPTLQNISDLGFKAVEWLGTIKGWSGATKLSELLKFTQEMEALWAAGKKTEAVTKALAFYWDANGKAKVAGLLSGNTGKGLPGNPPPAPVSQ